MEKAILRNKLFNKYFEIEEGIPAIDLLDKLSFIKEVWEQLHILCATNIKHFHPYSSLDSCKIIEHNKKKYLILKLRCWRYVIIDIEKKENITQEQLINEFYENFFVENFDEQKEEDENIYYDLYNVSKYNGDIDKLLDFYKENQDVLCLSTELYYKFNIDNAVTSFCIDFANARANMRFYTPDQFLYENLFLKYDLTPSPMQDAHEKIGIERMNEMLAKIKTIKIPAEYIPSDLYEQYITIVNNNEKKLNKVKK